MPSTFPALSAAGKQSWRLGKVVNELMELEGRGKKEKKKEKKNPISIKSLGMSFHLQLLSFSNLGLRHTEIGSKGREITDYG